MSTYEIRIDDCNYVDGIIFSIQAVRIALYNSLGAGAFVRVDEKYNRDVETIRADIENGELAESILWEWEQLANHFGFDTVADEGTFTVSPATDED
jgi:hypothetical protein